MTVGQLKENMTWVEYQGWIAFYAEKKRRQEVADGNLMAMDSDDQILGAFGL